MTLQEMQQILAQAPGMSYNPADPNAVPHFSLPPEGALLQKGAQAISDQPSQATSADPLNSYVRESLFGESPQALWQDLTPHPTAGPLAQPQASNMNDFAGMQSLPQQASPEIQTLGKFFNYEPEQAAQKPEMANFLSTMFNVHPRDPLKETPGGAIARNILGVFNSPAAQLLQRLGRAYAVSQAGAPAQAQYLGQRQAQDFSAGQGQLNRAHEQQIETEKYRQQYKLSDYEAALRQSSPMYKKELEYKQAQISNMGKEAADAAEMRSIQKEGNVLRKDELALKRDELSGKKDLRKAQMENIKAKTEALLGQDKNLDAKLRAIIAGVQSFQIEPEEALKQIDSLAQAAQRPEAPAKQVPGQGAPKYKEGERRRNPTTGQTAVFHNGQWSIE